MALFAVRKIGHYVRKTNICIAKMLALAISKIPKMNPMAISQPCLYVASAQSARSTTTARAFLITKVKGLKPCKPKTTP